MYSLRFDLRAKDGPDTAAGLYAAAIEMSAWADARGCAAVHLSEHHASPDGYLPAPIPLATAIAARTERVPIQVAALILPLHDPIELAEQMAVADLISRGRISYVCAVGYRSEEYAMFGQSLSERGARIEESIQTLEKAWSGEPFEYQGRPARVTPRPLTPGGPMLLMGGNAPVVARRAARFGMGMIAQGKRPDLEDIYRAACDEYGTKPGLFINPADSMPTSCFVAEDPDAAWAEIGPYLLHDAQMYAKWLGEIESVTKSPAQSVDELRSEQGNYRIFTPEEAIEHTKRSMILLTQPLAGGIPPELAWPSLELIVEKVMPAL